MKKVLIAAVALLATASTAQAYGRGYAYGPPNRYVYHRGHGHGWGGFVAGAIIGGAIAGAYRPRYYAPPPPVYYEPPPQAPVYVAPYAPPPPPCYCPQWGTYWSQ